MNKIIKLALVLGIIGALSGAALAGVYKFTAPVIRAQDAKELQDGLSEVFPGNYKFEKLEEKLKSPDPAIQIIGAYAVKSVGSTIGAILKVSSPGDQAPIVMLVGVNKDGTISGVKILESLETAGLGANASNPHYYVNKEKKITFLDQFKNKKITDDFVPKKDVIAITGATITSTAVSKGVRIAGQVAYNYLGREGGSK